MDETSSTSSVSAATGGAARLCRSDQRGAARAQGRRGERENMGGICLNWAVYRPRLCCATSEVFGLIRQRLIRDSVKAFFL